MQNLTKVARRLTICPVCGKEKNIGSIVCWGECWRGENGLKHSPLSDEQWLINFAKLNIEDILTDSKKIAG